MKHAFAVLGTLLLCGVAAAQRSAEVVATWGGDEVYQVLPLGAIPSVQTTWAEWKRAHPETELLEKTTEVRSSRYQSYFDDPERLGLFRAQWLTERMPGKTPVWGVTVGVHAVAVTDSAPAGRSAFQPANESPRASIFAGGYEGLPRQSASTLRS